jgi:hypothetical protein
MIEPPEFLKAATEAGLLGSLASRSAARRVVCQNGAPLKPPGNLAGKVF